MEQEEDEELAISEQGVTCGTERWSVKTGSDADISRVNLTSTTTTIASLVGLSAPGSLPANNRVSPVELTTYRLRNVTMTKYKAETDSDYHIVVSDGSRTMIVEIPHPGCVSGSSPLYSKIQSARAAFDAKYSATSSFKTSSDTVTVVGVGFWDFAHGQTGVAPNAIELHAVTFFCSGLNC
ncbi:MAG: hypothetical protein ACJ8AT_15595 [Hyalangium sp.]|uniref:hypothetical protein n=1 Tax=Hyalangium sp. TaxID=2028555 RepID=UPI00389A7F7B